MVKRKQTIEEKALKAYNDIENSLSELSRKVDESNIKLDHLIDSYSWVTCCRERKPAGGGDEYLYE